MGITMAGTSADTTGNTIGCHLYHANAAAGTGAMTHCPHAGIPSEDPTVAGMGDGPCK